MDALPAELLELVVDHCDHASLKNLRSVNRQCHDACTSGVFEDFYMGLFRHSLENLVSLSKSPLATHVTSFTFYADILPYWDREHWEEAIDYRPDLNFQWVSNVQDRARLSNFAHIHYDEIPRHHFTDQQLDDGYYEYRRLRKWQQQWREDIQGMLVKEHFARLPNVTSVTVVPATPFLGRIAKWPVWKRLRRKILVSPDDWMYAKGNYSYGAPNAARAKVSGQAALCMLEAIGFRASFIGTKHIRELTLHTTQYGPFRNLMGWYKGLNSHDSPLECVARCNVIAEGFRHLEELNLKIPHAAESDAVGGEATGAELVGLLHAAKRLRRLCLTYSDDDTGLCFFPQPLQPSLAPLLTTRPTWTQLEHLSLCIDMPHTLLLQFFRSLSPTLKSLELKDMVVEDVGELISNIPRILKLDHVYIECILQRRSGDGFGCAFLEGSDIDKPYERAIKAYLLGESEELPEMWWDVDGAESEHDGIDDIEDQDDLEHAE